MLAGLGAATGGSAACVPRNDLDDYAPLPAGGAGSSPATPGTAGAAGSSADPSLPEDPGSPPAGGGSAGGSAAGSGNAGGSGGAGDGASPDSGAPPPRPDAAPPTTSACAEGELEGPGASCFFLDPQTQTFFAARSACQARGSDWDLATVRSVDVSVFLGEALTFDGWLLASDVATEGTWLWLDDGSAFWQGGATGSPVAGAYSNWNATEPNGGNTTNCMRALPRSAGSANADAPWADIACGALRGSICQGPQ